MKMPFEQSAGAALGIGSALMLLTMVLHPSGGNLQHLVKMTRMIVVSHSLALLAIPFLAVGFWGLKNRLGPTRFLPALSFAMVLTALLAGMIAATINGVALPIFIQGYVHADAETIASVKPVLRNNIALNQAFDFVFIGAMSLAVLLWSGCILRFQQLPRAAGYFGVLVSLVTGGMLAGGFVFVNLHGFRLFVLGNVLWIVWVGMALWRSPGDNAPASGTKA